jgi:hypothetical protein
VKGDLERLIEAVEAGTVARSDLDAFLPVFGLTSAANDALDAYRGSLDAALRLHEALLPGWGWSLGTARPDSHFAKLWQPGGGTQGHIVSDTPARAFLLAILRALAKREEG